MSGSSDFLAMLRASNLAAAPVQPVAPPPRPQPEDPHQVVLINAQGAQGPRVYEFPAYVVARYPALADPDTRYLRLDCGAYELLLGQPVQLVSDQVLNDADDRARLLYVCQKLGRQLSDGEMSHVAQVTGLVEDLRQIRQHLTSFWGGVQKFFGSKRTEDWRYDMDEQLRHLFPAAVANGISTDKLFHLVETKSHAALASLQMKEFPGIISTFASAYQRFAKGFR